MCPVITHGEIELVQAVTQSLVVMLTQIFNVGAGVVPVGGQALAISIALISHSSVVTGHGVKVISTELPGELRGEASKGVEEGPGNDHVVIDGHKERHKQHSVAKSLEGGSHPTKNSGWSQSRVLANGELHEEERQTSQQKHQGVGHEERASSMLVAEIGEPPHIAKSDSITQAGEEEVTLVVPVSPLIVGDRLGVRLAGALALPHVYNEGLR